MKGVLYISLIRLSKTMQRSVSHGNTLKSTFLIIIMIIMTQVGYLDLINNQQTSNDSLSEETPVFETAQGTSIAYGNNTMGTIWVIGIIWFQIQRRYNSDK